MSHERKWVQELPFPAARAWDCEVCQMDGHPDHICGNRKHVAAEAVPVSPSHVCGLQGFGAPGDACPACAAEAVPCICVEGGPGSYEGPRRECPVHGAPAAQDASPPAPCKHCGKTRADHRVIHGYGTDFCNFGDVVPEHATQYEPAEPEPPGRPPCSAHAKLRDWCPYCQMMGAAYDRGARELDHARRLLEAARAYDRVERQVAARAAQHAQELTEAELEAERAWYREFREALARYDAMPDDVWRANLIAAARAATKDKP